MDPSIRQGRLWGDTEKRVMSSCLILVFFFEYHIYTEDSKGQLEVIFTEPKRIYGNFFLKISEG